jgi:transposase
VHLVNPSGLNWEDRRVKNDYRDCCDLLDRMRLGKLPETWIAPPAVRELRELVRYRARLVMLRTGLKAQLKAVLAKHGLRPPVNDLWGGVVGPRWLDQLDLPRAYTTRMESLRDLVEVYDREIDMLEREIHCQLKDHPRYRAIQAIPGVGRTIAAIMVAEIGDIARFKSPEELCSWAGLTPKHRESDTKVRRGRITKQGSKLVRLAAVEAVSNGRGGPKLKADYHRIAERRPKNVARVAVARKLLILVFPLSPSDPSPGGHKNRLRSRPFANSSVAAKRVAHPGQPSRALRSSAPLPLRLRSSRPSGTASPPLTAVHRRARGLPASRSQSSRLPPKPITPSSRTHFDATKIQARQGSIPHNPSRLQQFVLDSKRSVRDDRALSSAAAFLVRWMQRAQQRVGVAHAISGPLTRENGCSSVRDTRSSG